MTNEEKAKEIGRKWYFDNMQSNEAAYKGALMMAKCKEKQMIDKAVEYLEKHLCDFWQCGYLDDISFIEDFKKAMNKE